MECLIFGRLSLTSTRGPLRTATSDLTTRRSDEIVLEVLSIVPSVSLADEEISLRDSYKPSVYIYTCRERERLTTQELVAPFEISH